MVNDDTIINQNSSQNEILNFLDIDLNSYSSHSNLHHNQQQHLLHDHYELNNQTSNTSNMNSDFMSGSIPNLFFYIDQNNNQNSISSNNNNNRFPSSFSTETLFMSNSNSNNNNNNNININNKQEECFLDQVQQQQNQYSDDFDFQFTSPASVVQQNSHNQAHYNMPFSNSKQLVATTTPIKPPGSKILPLLTNKSAPVRLTSSTSCSYLNEFYQTGSADQYGLPHNSNSNNNNEMFVNSSYNTKKHQNKSTQMNHSCSFCMSSMPTGDHQFSHNMQNNHHHHHNHDLIQEEKSNSEHDVINMNQIDLTSFTDSSSVIQNKNQNNDELSLRHIHHQQQQKTGDSNSSLFQMEDFNLASPSNQPIDDDSLLMNNICTNEAGQNQMQSKSIESYPTFDSKWYLFLFRVLRIFIRYIFNQENRLILIKTLGPRFFLRNHKKFKKFFLSFFLKKAIKMKTSAHATIQILYQITNKA
jgi:hypothetical protein